jgi:hypothetical protein
MPKQEYNDFIHLVWEEKMFGSQILEVAIGLVVLYLVMSLFCTAVTEWISRVWSLRARTLKDGIYNLINDDKGLKETIICHPLFRGLSSKTAQKRWWDKIKIGKWEVFTKNEYGPSEIPPATFSQIVLDILVKDKNVLNKSDKQTVENIEQHIDSVTKNSNTREMFRSLLNSAKIKTDGWEGVVTEFRTSIEKWFDEAMQRVTGWYKRKTQVIILILAIVICFSLNVDTIGMANSLYVDPSLRASVVAAAEATVEESVADNSTVPTYAQLSKQLNGIDLHIGWTNEANDRNKTPDNFWGWVVKICGILLTVFAVALGSPFWFNVLRKIINLRSIGKNNKPAEETANPSL